MEFRYHEWEMWEEAEDMIARCDKVFVYGTLKRGHGNNCVLNGAAFLYTEKTEDKFALGCVGIPYAFPEDVIPEELRARLAHPIVGEVFRVPTVEIARGLDSLEGYPYGYNRRIIRLNSGLKAWIYTIEDWSYADGINAADYREGAWIWKPK